ncbi:MAG: metallophosphoesterase [Burkholderiales bacterium]|nr:metallophosphoesterase [Burkholderiales bacterium]
MRIQVASDLHLELVGRRFPDYLVVEPADADVLVLAGDIHRHADALDAFRDWPVPVVLIHGNHELYHGDVPEALAALAAPVAAGSRVRYLDKRRWVCGGVRFLGCCLWTDYALYGAPSEAMALAERLLLDHRVIRIDGRPFLPQDARDEHRRCRDWLVDELSRPFDGATVVCTHHAPARPSIHADYEDNPLNPCFISELTELMAGVDLWIHGHVHNSFDYRIGRTRVVANPRGYARNLGAARAPEEVVWENPRFDPRLVITLE